MNFWSGFIVGLVTTLFGLLAISSVLVRAERREREHPTNLKEIKGRNEKVKAKKIK